MKYPSPHELVGAGSVLSPLHMEGPVFFDAPEMVEETLLSVSYTLNFVSVCWSVLITKTCKEAIIID